MHWHWQNLNERPGDRDRATGSALKHGRAWWRFDSIAYRVEWSFGGPDFGAQLSFDSSELHIGGHLCLVFASLYWSVSGKALAWLFKLIGRDWDACKARAERETALGRHRYAHEFCARRFGFRVHSGALWWDCGADDSSRSTDPWWRHGAWHPLDTVLGRSRHSSELIEERAVKIPLPEGAYDAVAKLERCAWKRARWPFARVVLRVSIDVPKGIPVPGKGENSYDCGPDATYGLSCSARTVEQGIGEYVASVLRDRRRRGAACDYAERAA